MKKDLTTNIASFRASSKTAAKVARMRAFRKGLPVAISRDGKVFLVYKDNTEIEYFSCNQKLKNI